MGPNASGVGARKTDDGFDEGEIRRRLRKMKSGEVCYLFPGPCVETAWHGYVQKTDARAKGGGKAAARSRGFVIQGRPTADAKAAAQRYEEVDLKAAIRFATGLKPRALIVA